MTNHIDLVVQAMLSNDDEYISIRLPKKFLILSGMITLPERTLSNDPKVKRMYDYLLDYMYRKNRKIYQHEIASISNYAGGNTTSFRSSVPVSGPQLVQDLITCKAINIYNANSSARNKKYDLNKEHPLVKEVMQRYDAMAIKVHDLIKRSGNYGASLHDLYDSNIVTTEHPRQKHTIYSAILNQLLTQELIFKYEDDYGRDKRYKAL